MQADEIAHVVGNVSEAIRYLEEKPGSQMHDPLYSMSKCRSKRECMVRTMTSMGRARHVCGGGVVNKRLLAKAMKTSVSMST
jgi:hypothetical protein